MRRAELVEGWWADALSLLAKHGAAGGQDLVDSLKTHLKEATVYLRSVSQNATTLAGRFRDLSGLSVLLRRELGDLAAAQRGAMDEVHALDAAVEAPSRALVELAAHCGRCRGSGGGAMGLAHTVCRHCALDESFKGWEARAFALYTKAAGHGTAATTEDAVREVNQMLRQRAGRGGFGEEAGLAAQHGEDGGNRGEGGGGPEAEDPLLSLQPLGRRHEGNVAVVDIVRKPPEAEEVLSRVLGALRALHLPPGSAGQSPGENSRLLRSCAAGEMDGWIILTLACPSVERRPPCATSPAEAARKELLVQAGKASLELLQGGRRLYIKARALSTAQRDRLYAQDELDMCTMRMT